MWWIMLTVSLTGSRIAKETNVRVQLWESISTRFVEVGRLTLNRGFPWAGDWNGGFTIPWAGGLDWTKGKTLADTGIHISLLPDCGYQWFPHTMPTGVPDHERLCPQTVKQNKASLPSSLGPSLLPSLAPSLPLSLYPHQINLQSKMWLIQYVASFCESSKKKKSCQLNPHTHWFQRG